MTDEKDLRRVTRRHFFRQTGFGVGAAALASLMRDDLFVRSARADAPLGPRAPHFAPRAKSIIYLFMAGAPSPVDLLDHKPTLTRLSGTHAPPEIFQGERLAFIRGTPRPLRPPHPGAPPA